MHNSTHHSLHNPLLQHTSRLALLSGLLLAGVVASPLGASAQTDNGRSSTYINAARACNTGRLVGGLVGGGVGYAASRQDGRAWAIPLGALLGSQVGCNVGAGRAPTPW